MTIGSIFGLVLGIITSIGGIGAIFLFFVKKSSDEIAVKLTEKYQSELENEKAKIDLKIYISRTKFKAEYQMYRELSASFFAMMRDISVLVSRMPGEKDPKLAQAVYASMIRAQNTLFSNAVFMPEDFFNGYDEILRLCMSQITMMEHRSPTEPLAEKDRIRTEELNRKWKEQNSSIRAYLMTLDVLG